MVKLNVESLLGVFLFFYICKNFIDDDSLWCSASSWNKSSMETFWGRYALQKTSFVANYSPLMKVMTSKMVLARDYVESLCSSG